MQIMEVIRQAQGGAAVANLGQAFGLTPAQADAVLVAVVPELGRWVERNTLSRGGLADLVSALGHGHHHSYLDTPDLLSRPETRKEGDAILSHLLGSRDTSRGVAERAAAMSGVSSSIIRMMLPVIASMVMGGLAKTVSGGLGDILGRIGRGGASGGAGTGSGPGGLGMPRLPESREGGGLSLPPLDNEPPMRRGTGSGGWGSGGGEDPALPAGRTSSSSGPVELNPDGGLRIPSDLPDYSGEMPTPRRGVDNPYGDLADILRRGLPLPRSGGGGQPVPQDRGSGLPMPRGNGGGVGLPDLGGAGAPVAGGLLWRMIRGLIGSAFGFQGRGLMGWIVRMVVMRWGWAILRRVLGGR